MNRRNLAWGVAVLAVLAAIVVYFVYQAAGGSRTAAARPAIVAVVKKMLDAEKPAIPTQDVPQGKSPTPKDVSRLVHKEAAVLKTIYVPGSAAYRQNLSAYRAALARAESRQRLHVRVSKFHLISLTVNGNSASLEWTAAQKSSGIVRNPSTHTWSPPRSTTAHLEGTTVLRKTGTGWRISSSVENPAG